MSSRLSWLLLLLLSACTPKVGKVTVVPSRVGISLKMALTTLSVRVEDVEGNVLPDHPVTWSSSAPDVVSVSQTGVVRPHAGGVAIITATADGVSGTSEVTVRAPPCSSTPVVPTRGPVKPPPTFDFETLPITVPYGSNLPLALDVTGDRAEDLVVFSSDWSMPGWATVVFEAEADGGFRDVTSARVPRPIEMTAVRGRITDLGGDGTTDLILGAQCANWESCFGARNRVVSVRPDAGLVELVDPFGPDAGAGFTTDLDLADVDCDGQLDLYENNPTMPPAPQLSHLFMSRDGGLVVEDHRLPALITTDRGRYTVAMLCDVNLDGAVDLVLGGEKHAGRVLVNDGFGRFLDLEQLLPAHPQLDVSTQQALRGACTDVDLDGDPDLVFLVISTELHGPGHLQVLRNVDAGVFENVTVAPLVEPPQLPPPFAELEVRDLNADGWPDLLVTEGEGPAAYPRLYTNLGDGSFSAQTLMFGDLQGSACTTYADARSGRPNLVCLSGFESYLFRAR